MVNAKFPGTFSQERLQTKMCPHSWVSQLTAKYCNSRTLTRVYDHTLSLGLPKMIRKLLGQVHQENLCVGVLNPRVEWDLARVNIELLRVERGPAVRVRYLTERSGYFFNRNLSEMASGQFALAHQVHDSGGAAGNQLVELREGRSLIFRFCYSGKERKSDIFQSTFQQVRESEVAQVVGGHDGLVAVGSVPLPRAGAVNVSVSPRVVDEEVDLGKLLQHFPGESLDVGLGGQVQRERVDLGVAGCHHDGVFRRLALGDVQVAACAHVRYCNALRIETYRGLVSACYDNFSAPLGEVEGGLISDAGVAT